LKNKIKEKILSDSKVKGKKRTYCCYLVENLCSKEGIISFE